ncbi:hypothetical protein E2C01_034605 [Portunus trituberculatus]|uniref:Uncharacterized protein n=1 Tax=Portunus trituberculatus TaxID=210409 RepID=A0A5B7F959_PORTR|nr:hypothetical protein [Portunus trituberculatus]
MLRNEVLQGKTCQGLTSPRTPRYHGKGVGGGGEARQTDSPVPRQPRVASQCLKQIIFPSRVLCGPPLCVPDELHVWLPLSPLRLGGLDTLAGVGLAIHCLFIPKTRQLGRGTSRFLQASPHTGSRRIARNFQGNAHAGRTLHRRPRPGPAEMATAVPDRSMMRAAVRHAAGDTPSQPQLTNLVIIIVSTTPAQSESLPPLCNHADTRVVPDEGPETRDGRHLSLAGHQHRGRRAHPSAHHRRRLNASIATQQEPMHIFTPFLTPPVNNAL